MSTPAISRLAISMTQSREMTLQYWSELSALPGGMDRDGKSEVMVPGLPACSRLHALAGDVFPAHKYILQVLGVMREYQVP